jgi:hypothetical protein
MLAATTGEQLGHSDGELGGSSTLGSPNPCVSAEKGKTPPGPDFSVHQSSAVSPLTKDRYDLFGTQAVSSTGCLGCNPVGTIIISRVSQICKMRKLTEAQVVPSTISVRIGALAVGADLCRMCDRRARTGERRSL